MIRRLAACVREYKKDSLLTPLFVGFEVVMDVVIPLLMSFIIDYGIAGGNLGMIGRIGIALVIATLAALFFGVMSGRYAAKASAGFARNVRHDMFHKIQEYSFSNIDKFSAASLVTRVTTDVSNVQNAYQMLIRVCVRSPLMFIFSLIMAFTINAHLSLIFLGVIPVLILGLYLLLSRAHPLFRQVFRIYDRMNRTVQENLRGIRVVKSFVREDFEIGKFNKVSGDIYDTQVKAEKIMAFNSPLMQFAMYTCTLLISWLGGRMIVQEAMTTGQLVSLFSYTSQILMSLMMMSMVLVMISIARSSAERIVEVLEEVPSLADPENPVFDIPDGSVRFEDAVFCYGRAEQNKCLEGIILEINSGETIGIIGGTGSGKSTLVQLIPRLYDTTAGRVMVGGRDVREYDVTSLRDAVSMVLQKNVLFAGTIRENLRWGNNDADDAELVRVCKIAQADDFIREFPDGYDSRIEQGGSNVSGGQKQRLCIARALLKKPKILILDDSTSAVDTRTDALIRQGLSQELPDTTKIIIAQRIASIQDADRIIVMDGGRVNAVGTHDDLLKSNKIYREVYSSQNKPEAGHGAA
ncbi:ABC transporter ATP-binding protein [Breznakiella homolactica]|uniref:ABC transporter ATP-binding protein n=1 Tax=Breznakiella homolactica TaxID=2798577 RepID=A0A7T7XJ99_9SPIR|nr:ABC transporter ATP-binding protein [Breznakiella homolactica]QQO07440.1 ABC transporter ATP-binding protein/permease [Breznakiella homolactica]